VEKIELSSDGSDSGNKKCKRGYGGILRSLRLAGVRSQAVGVCFGAFDRNLVSVVVKMFSHLIKFIKKCYKCCIFNAICRDNILINYTSYATQQKLIFVNFDRSYARLISDTIQTVDGVQALMRRPLALFVRSREMPS
jgi:hypothetical protein